MGVKIELTLFLKSGIQARVSSTKIYHDKKNKTVVE
jgi:hypothetical protein